MNSNLELINEFHDTFGAAVEHSPVIPNKERILLRLSLILEELTELAEASDAKGMFIKLMEEKIDTLKVKNTECKSLQECLDALCDIQVVVNGTILEYGMQDVFDQAFQNVHSSNMSKTCTNEKDAILSVEKYKNEKIDAYYKKVNNRYVIYRKKDDKILKGVEYKRPELEAFLPK